MTISIMPENPVARIRHNLVGLRMPRALEALEAVIQQIERGQLGAIEAIDTLLAEEITVREGRRIKAALQMARLASNRGRSPGNQAGVAACRTRSGSGGMLTAPGTCRRSPR